MNAADLHTRSDPKFQDAMRLGANTGQGFSVGPPRRRIPVVAFVAGAAFGAFGGWVTLVICGRPIEEACAIGALFGLALYLVITGRKP